uniref:Uncharacterized protein n=1 Tax=Solanum lycopersicum TaxID=4081 RepID=A0A3Q7IT71_SOLLC
MPHESILFYSRLKHVDSSVCDQYTYSSVLKACAETKGILVGKAVHRHILFSGIHTCRIVSNSLLNMYSATCLTLDNGSDCGCLELCIKEMLLRGLLFFHGIKPTVVSFINVFPTVSEIRDVRVADVLYGLLAKLGNAYVNDLFVVSASIVMYAELGCINLMTRLFENTSVEAEDAVTTDDVTFVSALRATSQLQHLEFTQLHACLIKKCTASVTMFYSLRQNALEPDAVTFVAVLSTCSYTGLVDTGL